MQKKEKSVISGVVCAVIILLMIFGLKLNDVLSIVSGTAGFGVTYYLLSK